MIGLRGILFPQVAALFGWKPCGADGMQKDQLNYIVGSISVHRSIKYRWYRFQWWLAGYGINLRNRPLHVDIELAGQCNLACVMCPFGDKNWDMPKGLMPMERARDLVKQAAALGVYAIKFNFRGEPGLHKGLAELCAYAKSLGILEVMINTNLLAFSYDRIIQLVRSGIDKIIVSCDGYDKETYEAIRIGGDFERLRDNLQVATDFSFYLTRWTGKPEIIVQASVPADQVSYVRDRLAKLHPFKWCKEVIAKPIRTPDGERQTCGQPFRRVVMGWNGNTYACCNAWNEESVHDEQHATILGAWEASAGMRKLARDPTKSEPCKSCQIWESYK